LFLRSVVERLMGSEGSRGKGERWDEVVHTESAWWAGRKYQVPRTRACTVQELCLQVGPVCQRRVDNNPQDSDSRNRIASKLGKKSLVDGESVSSQEQLLLPKLGWEKRKSRMVMAKASCLCYKARSRYTVRTGERAAPARAARLEPTVNSGNHGATVPSLADSGRFGSGAPVVEPHPRFSRQRWRLWLNAAASAPELSFDPATDVSRCTGPGGLPNLEASKFPKINGRRRCRRDAALNTNDNRTHSCLARRLNWLLHAIANAPIYPVLLRCPEIDALSVALLSPGLG
jgi:hypothetical protein